jgi:hypothetical protein
MGLGPRIGFAIAVSVSLGASLAVSVGAAAAPVANLSRTQVSFGKTPVLVGIVQPVFVTNTGDAPLTISGISLTGTNATDFIVGGTCVAPLTLVPAGRCRIEITSNLAFLGPGGRVATLTVQSDSSPPPASVTISAILNTEIGHGLLTTPDWIDFPNQAVGTSAPTRTFTTTNPEVAGVLILESVVFTGGDAIDFTLTSNCVIGGRSFNGTTCTTTIGFNPTTTGPRSTELAFDYHVEGASTIKVSYRYSVTGVGGAAGPGSPTTVVEYYWATRDHYFISSNPAEIAALDAAPPGGWVRTGKTFNTYSTPQVGTAPVCRFYLPAQFGDSHFYGRSMAECDATHAAFPGFVYESPAVMYMVPPVLGNCPAGTVPVYRVFDARADANHRYMTDRNLRNQMMMMGWVAEGDGPDLVVMCAPQ